MAARDVPPSRIPDHFVVWVASDLHGQLAAVDRLLRDAGLTDGADRWTAPAGTALVVTGDVVDRGPDPVGLVRRLASLRSQAAEAGGCVALLEGNHEVELLGGLGGDPLIFRAFMVFGGSASLLSAGLRPDEWEDRPATEVGRRLDELAPDVRPALWTFAPYALWRDVLFVHAGPVPSQDLGDFERSAQRLWIRDAFFDSPHPFPDDDVWRAYRDAGIGRVVFGHTPVAEPTLSHGGRALNVDTWRGEIVTLARLEPGRDLADATFLQQPAAPRAVDDLAVGADEMRRHRQAIVAAVDAWVEANDPSVVPPR
jgi:serine/threonine protein phosphatase 1